MAIVGALSAASPNFLPDGRRFCWGLLSHRRYVDECVSIRPGRKGAVFPIFSSSVASRKNLRTSGKKFWDAAMRSQQSATLRRNRIVVDKKRRDASRNSVAERVFSLRSIFAQVGIAGRKLEKENSSHIGAICPRRARFRRDGLKGEGPMASPKRSDRRGSSDRGKRAPD